MKGILVIVTILSAYLSNAQKLTNGHQYASAIDSTDLHFVVSTLASEAMEGRKTGTFGQRAAAQFIARQFDELGVSSFSDYNSYFQPFELVKSTPDQHQVIMNNRLLEKDIDYVFLGELNKEVSGQVLDSRSINLDTLQTQTSKSIVLSDHLGIHQSIENLRSIGFSVFIVLMEKEAYQGLNSQQKISGERGEYFRLQKTTKNEFGIFYMSEELWAELANDGNSDQFNATFNIYRNEELIRTENVLGYIKGEGLEDEWIVISAHFDHLGVVNENIMYGADDNASGVAAMLEIAEALQSASDDDADSRRSVLFVAFTGEEQGLLGSEFFVDSELYDKLDIHCVLNIDMLGRVSPEYENFENYVYLIGSDRLSPELHEISERANDTYSHLILDYTYNEEDHPLQIYQRSDQWSFVKKGIPSIFYFGGVHDDYHKTSDTVDKINYGLLIERTRLIYHTALTLLNPGN